MGFELEDFAGDAYEVWPENWPAWCLYMQVAGQWRAGFGGAYALDYGVVILLLNRQNLPPDEWQQMFDDLRVIESAALDAMARRSR